MQQIFVRREVADYQFDAPERSYALSTPFQLFESAPFATFGENVSLQCQSAGHLE